MDQGLTTASLCSGGGVWSQHEQASNIKAEQFRSFTRANYEHKVAAAISVFSSQAMYDRLYISDLLIWQKWEFLYCHKNLGLNDQDRKIYGIIFICCHIGNYPP